MPEIKAPDGLKPDEATQFERLTRLRVGLEAGCPNPHVDDTLTELTVGEADLLLTALDELGYRRSDPLGIKRALAAHGGRFAAINRQIDVDVLSEPSETLPAMGDEAREALEAEILGADDGWRPLTLNDALNVAQGELIDLAVNGDLSDCGIAAAIDSLSSAVARMRALATVEPDPRDKALENNRREIEQLGEAAGDVLEQVGLLPGDYFEGERLRPLRDSLTELAEHMGIEL